VKEEGRRMEAGKMEGRRREDRGRMVGGWRQGGDGGKKRGKMPHPTIFYKFRYKALHQVSLQILPRLGHHLLPSLLLRGVQKSAQVVGAQGDFEIFDKLRAVQVVLVGVVLELEACDSVDGGFVHGGEDPAEVEDVPGGGG
jgi:hypothetical protein